MLNQSLDNLVESSGVGYLSQRMNITPDPAYILVIISGCNALLPPSPTPVMKLGADGIYNEHIGLPYDTKAKMRGNVVNKKARYNLCFSDFDQNPYTQKERVELSTLPYTSIIRN